MAKVVTYGLESVQFGDIAVDGGVATTFASKGLTFKDTFEITEADPESNTFMSEENDDPEVIITTQGALGYKFQLMNASLEDNVYFRGGEIVDDVWQAPDITPEIEKSVKITPKKGHIVTICRAKIVAKEVGTYSKTGLANLEITITVMKPKKAGEPKLTKEDK